MHRFLTSKHFRIEMPSHSGFDVLRPLGVQGLSRRSFGVFLSIWIQAAKGQVLVAGQESGKLGI